MTHDTHDTKDSDQTLNQKLETLEKGDKVEVNSVDGTLTVQEVRPRVHYEVVLEDSEGITYSLTPHLVRDEVLTIEPSTAFADQRIVREIQVKEKPNTFIQDREKTDSRPETGDRFVLTTVYPNGDVEDHAYSNDRDELEELMDEVEK